MNDFLLDDEDLAYVRAEQALVRPSACTLQRQASEVPDGRGGTRTTKAAPEPIQARITRLNSARWRDAVPQDIADVYASSNIAKIHLDLVSQVKHGDTLTEDATARRYLVVSDGRVDEWTTAQIVWGVLQ